MGLTKPTEVILHSSSPPLAVTDSTSCSSFLAPNFCNWSDCLFYRSF